MEMKKDTDHDEGKQDKYHVCSLLDIINPYRTELSCKKHRNQMGFFQYVIIINILVSSFCFI